MGALITLRNYPTLRSGGGYDGSHDRWINRRAP